MSLLTTTFLSIAIDVANDGRAIGRLAASGRIPAKARDELVRAMNRDSGDKPRFDESLTRGIGSIDDEELLLGLMHMWECENLGRKVSELRQAVALDAKDAATARRSLIAIFIAGYRDGFLPPTADVGHALPAVTIELENFAKRHRARAA